MASKKAESAHAKPRQDVEKAKKILIDGLKYYEYDGRDMPKRVTREALVALGVPEKDQPT